MLCSFGCGQIIEQGQEIVSKLKYFTYPVLVGHHSLFFNSNRVVSSKVLLIFIFAAFRVDFAVPFLKRSPFARLNVRILLKLPINSFTKKMQSRDV